MLMTQKDRTILRDLAKRQAEIAALPEMAEKKKLWYDLNGGKADHPLVVMEFHGIQSEVYPPLVCESPLARAFEAQITGRIFKFENFRDDRVIPAEISVGTRSWFKPFDHEAKMTQIENGMGYMFEHIVKDLKEDCGAFKPSTFSVDAGLSESRAKKEEIEDVLGDILPVRLSFSGPSFNAAHIFIRMMSMETMFLSIVDYPELFHKFMRRLTDDYIAYIDALEQNAAIVPNNDGTSLGQDSYGYTHDLPGAEELDRPAKFSDVWAYANYQETVGMSNEMFDEFFFSYTKEFAARCGLLAYGCCEPVHTLWEPCLSKVPNLRKLSVSPWCDEEAIGEMLRGTKIVYHRKPFPNYISVDTTLDEDALLKHMEKTVKAARGCPLEVTFRDITSVRGEPQRLTRAVEITRRAFEGYCG